MKRQTGQPLPAASSAASASATPLAPPLEPEEEPKPAHCPSCHRPLRPLPGCEEATWCGWCDLEEGAFGRSRPGYNTAAAIRASWER